MKVVEVLGVWVTALVNKDVEAVLCEFLAGGKTHWDDELMPWHSSIITCKPKPVSR